MLARPVEISEGFVASMGEVVDSNLDYLPWCYLGNFEVFFKTAHDVAFGRLSGCMVTLNVEFGFD